MENNQQTRNIKKIGKGHENLRREGMRGPQQDIVQTGQSWRYGERTQRKGNRNQQHGQPRQLSIWTQGFLYINYTQ